MSRAPATQNGARPTPARDRDGRFTNPWPIEGGTERGLRHILRWRMERARDGVEPSPPADALPIAAHGIATPRAEPGDLRMTWVGQCTFLIQIGTFNVLTDPVWSRRASPVQWAGPARLVPPGVDFDDLPPIDAVVLSHDHYDHLDAPTIRRISRRHAAARWVTPLGYGDWLRDHGVAGGVTGLDWWQSVELAAGHAPGPDVSCASTLRITAAPSQHWTKRTPFDTRRRLWASFVVEADGRRVYFCGDSGYHPAFHTVGDALGPFDAALMPIGAYAPRWFMRAAHMSPEEAVRAYRDLGGTGVFGGMHWGTFRLADEPVLEPPARTRAAWLQQELGDDRLWIPQHGETRTVPDMRR